jgi:hypothetical protein
MVMLDMGNSNGLGLIKPRRSDSSPKIGSGWDYQADCAGNLLILPVLSD